MKYKSTRDTSSKAIFLSTLVLLCLSVFAIQALEVVAEAETGEEIPLGIAEETISEPKMTGIASVSSQEDSQLEESLEISSREYPSSYILDLNSLGNAFFTISEPLRSEVPSFKIADLEEKSLNKQRALPESLGTSLVSTSLPESQNAISNSTSATYEIAPQIITQQEEIQVSTQNLDSVVVESRVEQDNARIEHNCPEDIGCFSIQETVEQQIPSLVGESKTAIVRPLDPGAIKESKFETIEVETKVTHLKNQQYPNKTGALKKSKIAEPKKQVGSTLQTAHSVSSNLEPGVEKQSLLQSVDSESKVVTLRNNRAVYPDKIGSINKKKEDTHSNPKVGSNSALSAQSIHQEPGAMDEYALNGSTANGLVIHQNKKEMKSSEKIGFFNQKMMPNEGIGSKKLIKDSNVAFLGNSGVNFEASFDTVKVTSGHVTKDHFIIAGDKDGPEKIGHVKKRMIPEGSKQIGSKKSSQIIGTLEPGAPIEKKDVMLALHVPNVAQNEDNLNVPSNGLLFPENAIETQPNTPKSSDPQIILPSSPEPVMRQNSITPKQPELQPVEPTPVVRPLPPPPAPARPAPSAPQPLLTPTQSQEQPEDTSSQVKTIITPEGQTTTTIEETKPSATQGQGYLINFNNVGIIEFIRFISKITNKNFIFDEAELQFNVTIVSEQPTSLENIMTALVQELRIHNLSLIEQGNNFIIHSNSKVNSPATVVVQGKTTGNATLETRVYTLTTLDAKKAAELIRPLLSEQALVEPLQETGNIVITESRF